MKKIQSPQTTAAAILTLVVAVITLGIMPVVDADPNTLINFEGLGAALVVAWGFWKSRDQKQHDKDVGAA